MGIRGLSRWLAQLGCSADLSKHGPLAALPTDHLLIDMNCVMHLAYDSADPSRERTLQRTARIVQDAVARFRPAKSLTIVFDGFAPLAKLQVQRERRAGYAIVGDAEGGSRRGVDGSAVAGSNSSSRTDSLLHEGEITPGSPYVLQVEAAIAALVFGTLTKQQPPSTVTSGASSAAEQPQQRSPNHHQGAVLAPGVEVFISSSIEVGEGEVKIARRLQTLSPDNAPSDDCVVLLSNDSDLILVGVAALAFHNIWLVDPRCTRGTTIGMLMLRWMDSKLVDALVLEQLAGARLDFVFIMLLAGGDFFTGLDDDTTPMLWNRYVHKRSRDSNFARRRLVTLAPSSTSVTGFTPVIDPELFAAVVVGKPRGEGRTVNTRGSGRNAKTPNQRMKARASQHANNVNRAANPTHGAALASFALWNLEVLVMGRCDALGVSAALGTTPVALASLQSFAANATAVAACRPRRTVIGGLAAAVGAERPPLFTFVAVAARATYLPPYVQRILLDNVELRKRLERAQSATHIIAAADEVLALVRALSLDAMAALPLPPADLALVAPPDPTAVGTRAVIAGGARQPVRVTSEAMGALLQALFAFGYPVGRVIGFRGLAKDDVLAVVAEPSAGAGVAAADAASTASSGDVDE